MYIYTHTHTYIYIDARRLMENGTKSSIFVVSSDPRALVSSSLDLCDCQSRFGFIVRLFSRVCLFLVGPLKI